MNRLPIVPVVVLSGCAVVLVFITVAVEAFAAKAPGVAPTSVVVRPEARKWVVRPVAASTSDDTASSWARIRSGMRPWVSYRPTLRDTSSDSRVIGDITLSAVGLRNLDRGENYGLLRLASRLDVERPGGLPIRWQHHASLYADSFPGTGSALASRNLVTIRRAQLGILAGPVTANIGRIWAADAAMTSAVDGVSASFRAHDSLTMTAWGGISPQVQGLAPGVGLGGIDVARTGASLAWQADESGRVRGAIGWSTAFVQGRIDDQRLGLQLHASDPEWGGVSGAIDLGVGHPDLAGTTLENVGFAQPSSMVIRPMRAWLSAWNRPRANWQTRLWYSFHRTEATRELALSEAWDTMVNGVGHAMNLSVGRRFARSWWWRQRLWGSWNDFGDYNDGLRLGSELRAGYDGEVARPFLWLRGESGLAFGADTGTATGGNGVVGFRTSLAASGGLGTRLSLSSNVALDLRGGVRYDDLIASESTALRGRGRAGLELTFGRWLWLLSVAGDKHLTGTGPTGWSATDFVEAMALVRFRI